MSTINTTPAVKKKFDVVDLLISFLPLIIMVCLLTAATIPAIIVGIYQMRQDGTLDIQNTSELLASPDAQTALAIGFIGYAVITIVIFFFWYKKAFLKKQIKLGNKEVFSVKKVILAIVLILGTSAVINLGLSAVDAIAPSVIESYSETMDSAGLGSNLVITLIYACILGPIAEELMFRGVTQAYIRKSGLPAAAVIIITAVLFGIAHMNPVQSTYATVFGLSLGLLRHKYGNIRITSLAHIVFNVFGTYGVALIAAMNLPDIATYIIFAILAVAGIVAAVFICKEPATKID